MNRLIEGDSRERVGEGNGREKIVREQRRERNVESERARAKGRKRGFECGKKEVRKRVECGTNKVRKGYEIMNKVLGLGDNVHTSNFFEHLRTALCNSSDNNWDEMLMVSQESLCSSDTDSIANLRSSLLFVLL